MKRFITMLMIAGSCIATTAQADSVINIRLSCKVILDFFGDPPPSFDDGEVELAVGQLNQLMETYGSGYRFVLVDPVIFIGGGGSSRPLPSTYFDARFRTNPSLRDDMESDAIANPALYAWNPTAVNIFIHNDTLTLCPRFSDRLIVLPAGRASLALAYIHAVGLHLNLCHVSGCECTSCCEVDESGVCHTAPGNDGTSDTLPNTSCWNQDQIAQHNFGVNYNQLSASLRSLVDDVYLNVLSNRTYCSGGFITPIVRLTGGQLDRLADTASLAPRLSVCDGQMFYVDATFTGFETGRSTNPFDRVAEGLSSADSGGDIVMIRSGNYAETIRISTPVTLRTPRGHTARIGG
jgi:hypothetical protein